ncbi:hypothetical protein OUZ56_032426 [Daphnia magna]|uniref:Uncharacterized protein n=1 Tax=Daphnia magna TaxID=35525 RepID=A0ABR0B8W3_9CRUS|nr:hypothetical protein OUZ56_032426 [Daphnia magna]
MKRRCALGQIGIPRTESIGDALNGCRRSASGAGSQGPEEEGGNSKELPPFSFVRRCRGSRRASVRSRRARGGAPSAAASVLEDDAHRLLEDCEEVGKITVANDEGRGEIDGISERSHVGATLPRLLVDAPADATEVAAVPPGTRRKVGGGRHPDTARSEDSRVIGEARKGCFKGRPLSGCMLENLLVTVNSQNFSGECGSKRMTAEGVPVVKRAVLAASEAGFDVRGYERRRHREELREGLPYANEVGGDSGPLGGPERARTAIAGEHLIADEEDVVARAKCTQFAEEVGAVHPHPGRPLKKWLHDDRCDFCMVACQRFSKEVEGFRVAVILDRCVDAVEEQVRKRSPKHIDAAERGGPNGVAVERSVEGQKARLFRMPVLVPVLGGHLDGDLYAP